MSGPIPDAPSGPIPPPVAQAPWSSPSFAGGLANLTPNAFEFLTKLWAAVAGNGGLIDVVTAMQAEARLTIFIDAEAAAVRINSAPVQAFNFSGDIVATETSPGVIEVSVTGASGGTVTSVAIASPLATLSVSGSPITGAGTIDLEVLKLQTARTFSYTGDATGGPTAFDGSANVSTALTLSTTGVGAGSYGNSVTVATFTVDAKGRLTLAGNVAIAFPQGAIDIEDEGVSVLTAELTVLNFTGAGVTAAETAPGVVEIEISGGGAGPYPVPLVLGTNPPQLIGAPGGLLMGWWSP